MRLWRVASTSGYSVPPARNRIAENATWDQALLRDTLAAVQAVPDIDFGPLGFSAAELADTIYALAE